MKRINKYPETDTFHYFNANPKNKITEDCVFRAIARALGINYNDVVIEMANLMCKTGYALNGKKCIDKYLGSKGWIKMKQPRKVDNTKYTGKEFCRLLADKKKSYVANLGGNHIVAIIDGKVNDIWDSTDGCIGNYWVKY